MYKIFFIFLTAGIIFISGCTDKNSSSESGKNDSTSGDFTIKKPFGFNEFYFVGMIGKNPGIYKFISKGRKPGISEKSFSKFWSKRNEKVIKLSYSPDKKSLFFLTAVEFGKKAIFPFINGVKLYEINLDSSRIKFITKIGNGLQVFTMWGQDNIFRVVLNSFDRNSTDLVNQQTFLFNEAGKNVNTNSKGYNITKEGYPQLIEKLGMTSSPGSKYSIFAIDSTQTLIYLQSNSDGNVKLIASSGQKLTQADWSLDEKYLMFSTENTSRKSQETYESISNNSKLFIYSLDKKKITKTLDIKEMKNFFVTGDLLIFDKGFQKNSSIEIINYKTLKPFYLIYLHDGCGLKSIQ